MSITLEEAVARGMMVAYHAQRQPHVPAVITQFGNRTFGELNQQANRLVRALRDVGIGDGDSIAVVIRNRPEFVEALTAASRGGIRFTPINFHLKADEIGYIVDNCEAKAFIAEASLGAAPTEALRSAPNVRLALSVGGELEGFDPYDAVIDRYSAADIDDPSLGNLMLYTSGTTGRPKGVHRETREPAKPEWEGSLANYRPGLDVNLCTGPAYHAAPLLINVITPLVSGVTVVMMERWDAEETLRLIAEHRVTHTHMVATMFHRLLQLPPETRAKYDTSSMRLIIHGAAPCPVHVKHSMIEWFGPDRLGVLRGHRRRRRIHRRLRGMAEETRNGRPPRPRIRQQNSRRRWQRSADRHSGHDLHARPCTRSFPILQRRKENGQLLSRRTFYARRHGLLRRRRLSVPDGTLRGIDHFGRREHLSAGSGQRTAETSQRCSMSAPSAHRTKNGAKK